MSVHIGAQPGDIAERVLLPGDPMRAKWIAETFLQDATCYSQVRGMLGFTGTYQGVRVSVQGSGMGMPSASIYTHELILPGDRDRAGGDARGQVTTGVTRRRDGPAVG